MEAVLRRLKLKKGEPQDTEARKQLQQDLFAFDQVRRLLYSLCHLEMLRCCKQIKNGKYQYIT